MITVKMTGMDRLMKTMEMAAQATGRPEAVLKLVGTMARTEVVRNFGRQEDERGQHWKELKTPRRRGKTARATILVDRGNLRNGIHAEPPSTNSVVVATSAQTTAYAAIHNYGGQSWMAPGPRAIPARQYMYLNAEARDLIARRIAQWAVKTLKGESDAAASA